METRIAQAFMARSPPERAALIGRAPRYIQNADFINLLNGLPINARRGAELVATVSSLRAFAGIPGLADQVAAWLASA